MEGEGVRTGLKENLNVNLPYLTEAPHHLEGAVKLNRGSGEAG